MKLTKLLELHVVHDPDKGEVAVEMVATDGEKRVRYTAKGRYWRPDQEPQASLNFHQPTYDTGLSLFREVLPFGPALFGVDFACRELEVLEMKREGLPASTDAVAPPAGDEINNRPT